MRECKTAQIFSHCIHAFLHFSRHVGGLAAGGDPKVGRPGEGRKWFGRLANDSFGKTEGPAGWRAFLKDDTRAAASGGGNSRTRTHEGMVGPHEGSIARPEQELGINQGAEQRPALFGIQSP